MRSAIVLEGVGRTGGLRRAGFALLVLIVLAILAASSTSCVRTGHVGVVTLFGRVTGRTMPEGIHLVNPASRVTELDIKTREIKERASVPSKEGLMMGLEASVLYHLHPDRAPTIVAGAVMVVEAVELFGLDSTVVSDHDILRGAALEMVYQPCQSGAPASAG